MKKRKIARANRRYTHWYPILICPAVLSICLPDLPALGENMEIALPEYLAIAAICAVAVFFLRSALLYTYDEDGEVRFLCRVYPFYFNPFYSGGAVVWIPAACIEKSTTGRFFLQKGGRLWKRQGAACVEARITKCGVKRSANCGTAWPQNCAAATSPDHQIRVLARQRGHLLVKRVQEDGQFFLE